MESANLKKRIKKVRNPLRKRILRELAGDWRKYLVVSLFLILTIGFVSGMYVANESMIAAAEAGKTKYKLEDGHFELRDRADADLLSAISSGEKADIRQYYFDRAREELDEKFPEEFEREFEAQFASSFAGEFEEAFREQVRQSLLQQGMGEAEAKAVLSGAVEQAKLTEDYGRAYDAAWDEAYGEAWDEAYPEAYEEAWEKVREEVEKEYAKAAERYELEDDDFRAVPVSIYENFCREEEEDKDNDGIAEGTVRVYLKTEDVNLACLMEGRFPEEAEEIAMDRMHADNAGISVGDTVTVGGQTYRVTGLIAYVNYATLHEKSTDLVFDALKFNVAMVTREGFERLSKPVRYVYAWQYEERPGDEKEEKKFSDDFLKALLTRTVAGENETEDYMPRYGNPAINFATEDMGSDEAMGGVLLNILIVIIAFIFAVTCSNTMVKESGAIGTLRASGYGRGELTRHYLAMPVIVTLISAGVGNILGYTVFKNMVVSMYYNSYSLPVYETVWNPGAFVRTTLIPLILMFAVNLMVILKMMGHTPLQFLRHELKKQGRRKALRLPGKDFFGRFRLRIILQNITNYGILFVGILFVSVMLAMAVGLPATLNYYQENAGDMMFAKYQYVLKSYEDEEGNVISTENGDGEQFCMRALMRRSEALDEEINVYGIGENSRYVEIADLSSLKGDEAYITASFGDKYGLKTGDVFSLEERYENGQYEFKVAGIYDGYVNLAVFMPVESFRALFDLKEEEFHGWLSDSEIRDVPEESIATVITQRDITKMCDQLDHSMGSYMQYFQILCVLLSAVLIYLLTKIIIEKNESAISMIKILGYENREIAGLYMLSTTTVVILADILCVFWGTAVMEQAWRAILSSYTGWFSFVMEPAGYAKIFIFILSGYLLVTFFDFRRIRRIPLEAALKCGE